MITALAYAKFKGVSPRTIQRICSELGVKKFGNGYIITDDLKPSIDARLHDRKGRPSKD